MEHIIAYTDGSAVVVGKSKGAGGFGVFFHDLFGKKVAISLGYKDTKTGRMEIMALYYAIKAIPADYQKSVTLTVYSDSEYVVKSFTERRLEKWIQEGWKNSSGDVKNVDLWKKVLGLLIKRRFLQLEMKHIKSHQVEKEKDILKKEALLRDPHIIGNMMADWFADYKRHKVLLDSDKLN